MFGQIGCAVCHTPDLGGVAGVYSDFLLHRVANPSGQGSGYAEVPSVPLPDDHPLPDEWKTPPLWGVADSAPYFHDGGSPTLEAAIRRHKGDAASVTKAFESLVRLTIARRSSASSRASRPPAKPSPSIPARGGSSRWRGDLGT